VKPIPNRRLIRAPKLVWALLAILLVTSTIGTKVWAEKPDNLGKPSPPEPEIADYTIWIGAGTQDIRLISPDSLLVENVVGGYWLSPPTKGKDKAQKDRLWGITLLGEAGDDCGKYFVEDVPGDPPYQNVKLSHILADHGVNGSLGAVYLSIEHVHTRVTREGERDYWLIWIGWDVGTLPGESSTPHLLITAGRTNIDAEWEGEYDEINDAWTVTFNNAEFGLIENDESGSMTELWVGQLSFTVKITRIPSES